MSTPSTPNSSAPVQPEPPVARSRARRAVENLALLVMFGVVTALVYTLLTHAQTNQDAVAADASACFAVVNAGVLLQSVSEVPSTESLAGALASIRDTAPVPVSVVRRSATTIGVEFSPEVARAQPDLARDYATLGMNHLAHPSCPHSEDARALVNRLLQASYP